MKRSAAPSNTHPSGASKKMKPTKVVESSVAKKDIKSLKVVAKSGPPPPINAKQQKAFHHLLSAAAYNSVHYHPIPKKLLHQNHMFKYADCIQENSHL